MTREQKQEVLAAMDTYADIFGPRLTAPLVYRDSLLDGKNGPLAAGCCCFIGALGVYDPIGDEKEALFTANDEARYFHWTSTVRRFGFKGSAEQVYRVNDGGPLDETPEQRFTRMRQWVEAYPTED